MKLHKECKVELAASKDVSRHSITEPYLDITDGKGVLVSTNGQTLVTVPVELSPDDVAGYVSLAVLKAARKAAPRSDTADIALAGKTAALADGTTMPRTALDYQFPNWRAVVPEQYTAPAAVIALDAKLLWELAQSMGTQGVCLTIKDGESAILVSPAGAGRSGEIRPANDGSRGVLMPIRKS